MYIEVTDFFIIDNSLSLLSMTIDWDDLTAVNAILFFLFLFFFLSK
jgi:hypothetical protein